MRHNETNPPIPHMHLQELIPERTGRHDRFTGTVGSAVPEAGRTELLWLAF
jgi:hypothetical protein